MSKLTFTRPKGTESALKAWQKTNGSLISFQPMKLKTINVFNGNRSGRPLMTVSPVDSQEERILLLIEEISFLQDENPGEKILMTAGNKIAKVGQDCHLNEGILIGKPGTELMLG